MKLVADAALGTKGEHRRALIAQGVGMFITAELAPRRVELAGHAKEIKRQIAGVFGRHREVVVTPTASGERLQLQMAEIRKNIMPTTRDVTGVVEDRHVGAQGFRGLGGAFIVFLQRQPRRLLAIFLFVRIKPVGLHEL